MKRERKPVRLVAPGSNYGIRILGDRPALWRDFYHALLRLPWRVTFATISGSFVVINALFAVAYLLMGGIAHARPGSFADAFFFSVQTMGTIGYGTLYPETMGANVLVVAESITSLTLMALATGLVFAKFSRSTARLVFTEQATISPMNGVPTLSFRLGNQRGNQIVDARIRAVLVRTETTAEGSTFYRMLDLELQRDHAISLQRSWIVFHTIDALSPLYGETPDSVDAKEIELQIAVVGLDDITMQTVHGAHRYFTPQILWGRRHTDIVSDSPDGDLVLDLRRFHDTEPTTPTPDFPYPPKA